MGLVLSLAIKLNGQNQFFYFATKIYQVIRPTFVSQLHWSALPGILRYLGGFYLIESQRFYYTVLTVEGWTILTII